MWRKLKRNNPQEVSLINEFIEFVKDSKIPLKIIKPQIRSFKLEFEEVDINEIEQELKYY